MLYRKKIHSIVVEGARTHNLKGVRVEIPHAALTVVTGVSGSGKSSLAFDTIYAEGQRRYVESLSTYARQFLERMQRPDVDAVEGVPPAIAIEQRNGVRNARSTVGTVTEISDYLRLLFARAGTVHCPKCDRVVERDSAQSAAAQILAMTSERVFVVARSILSDEELAKQGWSRRHQGGVLIDRLVPEVGRLVEALQAAFSVGGGKAEVWSAAGVLQKFDEGFSCSACGGSMRPPQPAHFSFNSPLGACARCNGFGRVIGIDLAKIVPDHRKTLREGAIAPFQMPSNAECQDDLIAAAKKRHIRLDVPWRELREDERALVIDGDPGYRAGGWKKGQWYGVRGLFKYLETKTYKMHVRVMLARFRGFDPCGDCGGARLKRESLCVRVGGLDLASLERLPVDEARAFLSSVVLQKQHRATASELLAEIDARLAYLIEVGLGYLTLSRQARTLSGGEAQRIALASALGAQLTGTLYVLDEPSVGLHARDSYRLVQVLKKLVARGNTVVVVEHDAEILRAADWVIDLGPGAGARGGEVVFAGTYEELLRDRESLTAKWLRDRDRGEPPRHRESPGEWLRSTGARIHNLAGDSIEFPVGRFSCITGVSGSGKSTLLTEVLNARTFDGVERFSDIVLVDQEPLARSSRSNPATYLKAMDELRARFAKTSDADKLGLTAGAFSFNVSREKGGGRCEACGGQGTATLEMHFLADVTVECDGCGGRRFTEKTLAVKWRGLSILDCLNLTVEDALARFADDAKLCARLRAFAEVGLGYLTLGQPTSTLSGGESQRLKLAAHLHAGAQPTLFLLDEPTTGLHGLDVAVLLDAIARLVEAGHTVIAIEHNLDFIRRADYVVDLGPEGGAAGGRLVVAGTPEEVARNRASHTGRALATLLRCEKIRG